MEDKLASLAISPPSEQRKATALIDATFEAESATVFMAMRKLREAIVATARADEFAQRAYMFIIHAAIVARDSEAYHPAMLTMVNRMHRLNPIQAGRLQSVVGLHVLDLACRQRAFAAAYAAVQRFGCVDQTVLRALAALVHDNWYAFWTARESGNIYQRHVMIWAEDGVRRHALNSIGRAYMSTDVDHLTESTGLKWHDLKDLYRLQWELDGTKVIIKKTKGK